MDISELGFGAINTIERIKKDLLDIDNNNAVVIYKNRKNIMYKALMKDGYLVLDTVNVTESYAGYDFYNPTEKMKNASIDKILMDLVGYDKETVLKKKVISITDVPYDYEDVFEALNSADGYFDRVDIGNGDWRRALDMHGFTYGAGANGAYSSGSEKLSEFCKNDNEYGVIEILTGKTKEENAEILANDLKAAEIKKMFSLAEKYGYEILTDKQYEDLI